MEEIGYLMIQIFILLLMAEVLGKILTRFGLPDIIGYILAGIIFVNLSIYTGFGHALEFDIDVVSSNPSNFLNVMGNLGLVFLLFGIGLETRLSELVNIGRNALIIAIVGIIFPFVGGFATYLVWDNNLPGAIMLGTTIFAMSAAVAVKLLQLLEVTESDLGRMVIGIAVFSDIICLILFAVNSALVSPTEGSLVADIAAILIFIGLIFLFIWHTQKRKRHVRDLFDRMDMTIDISHRDLFTLGIVLCLGFTAASYYVGLSGIVGAFLAGMYFAEFDESTHVHEKFETITKFLLPFFFISVGLKLRFDQMSFDALIIAVVLLVVAVTTKYAGGYAGARMCGVKPPVASFIGSSMVARGDIAIVVATLALSLGIFGTDLYAGVVIMAVLTQVSATLMMKRAYARIPADDPVLERKQATD